jgi:hypothetical protein
MKGPRIEISLHFAPAPNGRPMVYRTSLTQSHDSGYSVNPKRARVPNWPIADQRKRKVSSRLTSSPKEFADHP